jgi:hypothetical protein
MVINWVIAVGFFLISSHSLINRGVRLELISQFSLPILHPTLTHCLLRTQATTFYIQHSLSSSVGAYFTIFTPHFTSNTHTLSSGWCSLLRCWSSDGNAQGGDVSFILKTVEASSMLCQSWSQIDSWKVAPWLLHWWLCLCFELLSENVSYVKELFPNVLCISR